MLREGDAELQVMLSLDRVGAESLAAWKADVDLGDLVFVHGEVISSKRGELSVLADEWQLTAKALRPLPVAHKPLSDETRVRQRYVDLIVRPEARQMVARAGRGAALVARDVARPRLPRGRDADPADGARRRGGASVPHAPECIRPRHVAAHRHRVVPETVHRRRHRAGLRDRPGVPQRGRRFQPLAGVHAARGVRGLRRLRHDGRIDPVAGPRRRRRGRRRHRPRAGRHRDRPARRMALGDHARRGVRGGRRAGHRRHRRRDAAPARRAARRRRCARTGRPARSCSSCTRSWSSTR